MREEFPVYVEAIRYLAGPPADAALERSESLRTFKPELTHDAVDALRWIYAHFAFQKSLFRSAALTALDSVNSGELLRGSTADNLWNPFNEAVSKLGERTHLQSHYGPIVGLAELAQELYREDGVGSPIAWIKRQIFQLGRIEPAYTRLLDIRGLGPKNASLLIRDVVWALRGERYLHPVDRPYLQSIDRGARILLPVLLRQPDLTDVADFVAAGKLARAARTAGVSGIRLNFGLSQYGSSRLSGLKDPAQAAERLQSDLGEGPSTEWSPLVPFA